MSQKRANETHVDSPINNIRQVRPSARFEARVSAAAFASLKFFSVPAAFLESNTYGALNSQLMGPLQQYKNDPVTLLGMAAVFQGGG